MVFFSKVSTFSRPALIDALVSESNRFEKSSSALRAPEYFYLGLPPKQPMTPEGSMLFVLSKQFIIRNQKFFKCGSVGDTGGVKAGYITEIPKSYASRMGLGWEQFHNLISVIDNLPIAEKIDIHRCNPISDFPDKIENIVDPIVKRALTNSVRQDLWSIEFSIGRDFEVCSTDVLEVFVPNTYHADPRVKKLSACLTDTITFYNPRFPVARYAFTERNIRRWLLREH